MSFSWRKKKQQFFFIRNFLKSIFNFPGIPHLLDSAPLSSCIRRTASLDALYMKPSWKIAHQLQMQQQSSTYTILQLDKATQTDESCISSTDMLNFNSNISDSGDGSSNFNKSCGHINSSNQLLSAGGDSAKSDKVFRQRLQRVQQRSCEHSVSSQTLSPIHSKCHSILLTNYTWFQSELLNGIFRICSKSSIDTTAFVCVASSDAQLGGGFKSRNRKISFDSWPAAHLSARIQSRMSFNRIRSEQILKDRISGFGFSFPVAYRRAIEHH